MISNKQATSKVWDVIVIGAGMGGGIVGRRLAEAGLSILYVEKGPLGYRREQQDLDVITTDPVARLMMGAWPRPIIATVDGKRSSFFGPIGAGVGGSSVFYAGILERPEPHDLDDMPDRPHPTGGWPVSYAAMQPYFEQAEDILGICGESDPLASGQSQTLRPPPPLNASEKFLSQTLQQRGLHPYRLHNALQYLPECQGCLGHKCPKRCKMDGRSAGVEPALATKKAVLLDRCNVLKLHQEGRQIRGVDVLRDGQALRLQAQIFVLAAGALRSPVLLASSTLGQSEGCANSSGWVGRGLMFHLSEFFVLWSKNTTATQEPVKSLALRDFYFRAKQRLGLVQALGAEASYGNIVHQLNGMYDLSVLRRLRGLRKFTRIPAWIASKLLGHGKIFVGLIEDLQYFENRVAPDVNDPDNIRIHYNISPELLARRKLFRKLIRREMGGWNTLFLSLQPELNFGHPCGTLRFGNSSEDSVLNSDCRAHDVDILYVTDASFMPSSMGVNPSLTIAANALRVGDIIADGHVKRAENEAG